MRYFEALDEYYPSTDENWGFEKSIFLAGGITNCPNWQKKLVDLLWTTPNLTILNPRREHFPINDPNAARQQIAWEFRHFQKADLISFWFSRGSLNPIVLFELGKWLVQQPYKKIFIGIDPEYERKQDVEIQVELEDTEIEIVYSLEELAQQIRKEVK